MQTFWLQNEGSIKNPDICDEEARHLPLGRRLSRSQTLVIWYFLSLQQHSTDRSQQMHTESTNAQIHKYTNTQIHKYKNTQIHKYSIWQSARKTKHVVYFWKGYDSRISNMTMVGELVMMHRGWCTGNDTLGRGSVYQSKFLLIPYISCQQLEIFVFCWVSLGPGYVGMWISFSLHWYCIYHANNWKDILIWLGFFGPLPWVEGMCIS